MKRSRFANSDFATDLTEVDLRSKRVMEAPSFDDHRAEPSHQDLKEGPPLDVQRAKLLLQHLRALNTQFASWVQSQLQNHLDELWIDGVKDYQSHALNILEEFKSIVEWLRENSTKSQSNPSTEQGKAAGTPPANLTSPNTPMLPAFSLPKSISKPPSVSPTNQGNSIFPTSFPQTSSLFFSSQGRSSSNLNNGMQNNVSSASPPLMQNSSLFSSSQSVGFFATSGMKSSPIFPGIQTSIPQKVETSDADEEGEMEQPSSPSLKKTEEKGVSIVHEVKCKVFIKENPAENQWKDMGTGHLSIKCKEGAQKMTKESKPTIVVRNDVGRILLNALIYPGIKMNVQKTSIVTIFHTTGSEQGDSSDVVARTYLLRLRSLEDTTKLVETIKEYTPSA